MARKKTPVAIDESLRPATDLRSAVSLGESATWCSSVAMSIQPEISQRDLRLRSKEIMDSVERGQAFTVTRDGHPIGELVPLRRRRTFVSRSEFLTPTGTGVVDPERFRGDLDAVIDEDIRNAYDV